jgi:hypothetical protein
VAAFPSLRRYDAEAWTWPVRGSVGEAQIDNATDVESGALLSG